MAATEFARSDALAVQRWSTSLAVETEVKQYFRKFMGATQDSIIMVLKDLEKKPGESITYGMRRKLSGGGAEGDNSIEGTSIEEGMLFYDDKVTIDQRRKSTKSKGQMSEQRIPYDMRMHMRDALATYFAEDIDQQCFIYLSGTIPSDTTYLYPSTYGFSTYNPGYHSDLTALTSTGRAGNAIGDGITYAAGYPYCDTDHHVWGGDATAYSDIATEDIIDVSLIERLVAKIETLDPALTPIRINGEDKFVLLMHPYQAYSLRNATSENDWVDIHKNTDGEKSLLYQNALGEYAGIVLHKHRFVPRFYGTSVTIGRAMLLGAQAGTLAFGGKGQYGRYSWNEEFDDRGNALVITAGAIFGVTRCVYNSKLFGMLIVDAACDDPNSTTT